MSVPDYLAPERVVGDLNTSDLGTLAFQVAVMTAIDASLPRRIAAAKDNASWNTLSRITGLPIGALRYRAGQIKNPAAEPSSGETAGSS